MAKIHIMMATYNGEKYIREQIDSILNQTYLDWSLYISDDCSDDNTLNIINEYCERFPDRIFLLSSKYRHGGAKNNFIYLFNNCPMAEYYMFSDQDDYWIPTKIEKMVRIIEKDSTPRKSLIYCNSDIVDKQLNVIKKDFHGENRYRGYSKLIMKNYIPGCTMLLSNEIKRDIGQIPYECVMHDWWIVLYTKLFGNVIYLDGSLNLYRQHGENVIGANAQIVPKRKFYENLFFVFSDEFLLQYKRYEKILHDNIIQANCFYRKYKNEMNNAEKQVFSRFIKLVDHRMKGVFDFLKYYRTNIRLSNMYYILVILNAYKKNGHRLGK